MTRLDYHQAYSVTVLEPPDTAIKHVSKSGVVISRGLTICVRD